MCPLQFVIEGSDSKMAWDSAHLDIDISNENTFEISGIAMGRGYKRDRTGEDCVDRSLKPAV